MQWPCSTCGGTRAFAHATSGGVNSTCWTPRCSESRIGGWRGRRIGARGRVASGHVGKVSGAWPRDVAKEGTPRGREGPRERSGLQGAWPELRQSFRTWSAGGGGVGWEGNTEKASPSFLLTVSHSLPQQLPVTPGAHRRGRLHPHCAGRAAQSHAHHWHQ